ncbi:hypothetical protein E2C01_024622 [Portunus trituberculatus]|uniref:Zinc finger PHD-type domain-containing protein n=1 Tax=Portunus trituberculatus TaxID=210409 RepID=A0A5B7EFA7_PORTR|nr:hypothetical protein [Portunus trituberculatus]
MALTAGRKVSTRDTTLPLLLLLDNEINNKCGKCDSEVRDNDRAVACDICEKCFHIGCQVPQILATFIVSHQQGVGSCSSGANLSEPLVSMEDDNRVAGQRSHNTSDQVVRIIGYSHWTRRDRRGGQGGGLAVYHREGLHIDALTVNTPDVMEMMFCASYSLIGAPCFLIVGNLNHNIVLRAFIELTVVQGLHNHVDFPTHQRGGSLDPVLTDLAAGPKAVVELGEGEASVTSRDCVPVLTKSCGNLTVISQEKADLLVQVFSVTLAEYAPSRLCLSCSDPPHFALTPLIMRVCLSVCLSYSVLSSPIMPVCACPPLARILKRFALSPSLVSKGSS